jgi:mono/diheme cytochrome c family protein
MPAPLRPTPLDTPQQARQLDGYYAVGLVCMFLLIIAFPVYKLGEPARRERAKTRMTEENVTIGRAMFAQHCASCHGDDARGGRGFPTLGAKEFLASVSDRQLQWLISGGVPGTAMSAYDLDLGGPFTSQEVARLVAYLRSLEEGAPSVPDWFKGLHVAPAQERRRDEARAERERREGDGRPERDEAGDREAAPGRAGPPEVEAAGAPLVTPLDPARDDEELATLFATRCAACHGPDGKGTAVVTRAIRPLSAALAAEPDSAFRIISGGVAGTAMMPFSTEQGGALDPTTIRRLVQWLREPGSPVPNQ